MSLNKTVSQLQDELHSKCEELNRARLETQKAVRHSAPPKQVLQRPATALSTAYSNGSEISDELWNGK